MYGGADGADNLGAAHVSKAFSRRNNARSRGLHPRRKPAVLKASDRFPPRAWTSVLLIEHQPAAGETGIPMRQKDYLSLHTLLSLDFSSPVASVRPGWPRGGAR